MDARAMLAEIGLDQPYQRRDLADLTVDLQGWASDHPYFSTLIAITKPKLVVEVGTWKGASAINMAKVAKTFHPDVIVLCIDTWLGSNEVLWSDPTLRPLLKLENGSPTVYRQFLANVVHGDLTETIFPMPMTSVCAAELLQRYRITAELIYIDAGHGEYEVYGDLMHYWPLVAPGGILFGDDYYPTWNGVVKAVNRFAYEQALPLETLAGKWFFTKPAAT